MVDPILLLSSDILSITRSLLHRRRYRRRRSHVTSSRWRGSRRNGSVAANSSDRSRLGWVSLAIWASKSRADETGTGEPTRHGDRPLYAGVYGRLAEAGRVAASKRTESLGREAG